MRIQAGHVETYDALDELQVLRNSVGAFEADWDEWIVNLDISRRVVAILERNGLKVEGPPHIRGS